jgi:hypothetical protein
VPRSVVLRSVPSMRSAVGGVRWVLSMLPILGAAVNTKASGIDEFLPPTVLVITPTISPAASIEQVPEEASLGVPASRAPKEEA